MVLLLEVGRFLEDVDTTMIMTERKLLSILRPYRKNGPVGQKKIPIGGPEKRTIIIAAHLQPAK